MGLGGEVIDLVRLRLLNHSDEVGGVGHIAMMQGQALIRIVRVLIEMLNAAGVERRRTPYNAVDVIPLA